MRLIHTLDALGDPRRRVCAAIGFFDGVHLGHQQILRQTIADARQFEAAAMAITFDRHPNSIVAPARTPPLIYTLEQKLRVIESLGADLVLLLHFDAAFSRQTGEGFIRCLARGVGQLRSLCVGANFLFGHERSGDVDLLRRLGAELRFTVHGLAAVAIDDQPVSSTRIRERIRCGELDAAGQMLGRAYSLAGKVLVGDRLGQRLGFPTANIDTAGLVLPPTGVYAVRAAVAGRSHRAVLNIGYRPTLECPQPQLRVEAHLIDFQGDLYGQDLEIVFVDRLREEKKFGSIRELREQIARDILEALARF